MTDSRIRPPLPARSNRDPDPRSAIRTAGATPWLAPSPAAFPETSASSPAWLADTVPTATRPPVRTRGTPMPVRLDADGPPPWRAHDMPSPGRTATEITSSRGCAMDTATSLRAAPRMERDASCDRSIPVRGRSMAARLTAGGTARCSDDRSGDAQAGVTRTIIGRPNGMRDSGLSESRSHIRRTARNTAHLPSIAIPPVLPDPPDNPSPVNRST